MRTDKWVGEAIFAAVMLAAYAVLVIVLGFKFDVGMAVLNRMLAPLAVGVLLLIGAVALANACTLPAPWLSFLPAAFLVTRPLLVAKGTLFTPLAEIRGFEPDLRWYASPWFFWAVFLLLLVVACHQFWRYWHRW